MRNVLVTGGSRGIGLAIVRRLAGAGYYMIALARNPNAELSAAIAEAPGSIRFVPYDLSDVEGIPELVRKLKAEFGGIYGLVNNAGVGDGALLTNMHNSQIDTLIRVNVTAPILLTKYVIRTMMTEADGGRIINMSSIVGSNGYNALAAYGATKAAMIGFTKSLSREVGRLGVTVNAVAPGFIETAMTEGMGEGGLEKIVRRSALRRLAEVEDIAAAVEFLMGEGGRNITGTVLTIDAGNTA